MIKNIQNTKIELIQWLTTIEDEKVLNKLLDFRKQEGSDWWNIISESEKKSIEKGILDADSGNIVPHSIAKNLYEKWL
jgi:hypothetical protein